MWNHSSLCMVEICLCLTKRFILHQILGKHKKIFNFPKWAFVCWVIIWPDVELLFIFIITLFAFQKSTDKMNMFMKNKQKWRVIQAFMNESKSFNLNIHDIRTRLESGNKKLIYVEIAKPLLLRRLCNNQQSKKYLQMHYNNLFLCVWLHKVNMWHLSFDIKQRLSERHRP